jgi:S1-C subfamily serine protease
MDGKPTFVDEWNKSTQNTIKSVVSIKFSHTAPFDGGLAMSSQATGFVVDAKKGYILTNRHVVGPGPFTGRCIFENHEGCDVFPVYRDPVHDFGVLRYDPKLIKYMSVVALTLRPDFAKVGVDIRIIGNDGGEKLSILSGIISRIDRNAPEYEGNYADFNTNYIQASAAARGGSSGSPVVNRDGFAIGLQAGGRADGATTDYFLPLDRPLRALELIQAGEPVPRGTIQTQWLLESFDECRRLGLSLDMEEALRTEFPIETGILVARLVLPEGPASTKVKHGDLLIKVNGEFITTFVRLDHILDEHVGKTISVTLQRDGENMDIELDVGNLHDITPDRFVSVAGASFHELSYQQARSHAMSLKSPGVYVCEGAGSFNLDENHLSGWLILKVNSQPTPTLDMFIDVMQAIPDRKSVVIEFKHIKSPHYIRIHTTTIDRHWYEFTMTTRNDTTGKWDSEVVASPIAAVQQMPQRAQPVLIRSEYPEAVAIWHSFVEVKTAMPLKFDGFDRSNKRGHGLVFDAERGLVVVSRAVVPHEFCDVLLTFADSIQIDATIVYVHPLQNVAIVRYNPDLVEAQMRTPKFSTEIIKKGDDTIFFGFDAYSTLIVAKTIVADVTTTAVQLCVHMPHYRASHLDEITLHSIEASGCTSGVLMNDKGIVKALWLEYAGPQNSTGRNDHYFFGYATRSLLPLLDEIKKGNKPKLRIFDVDFNTITKKDARIMGVSHEWIEKVENADREHHQILKIDKVHAGHCGGMQDNDVLLALDNKLVTRAGDVDAMCNNTSLEAVIVRAQEEMKITVHTVSTEHFETDRIVQFCGAKLQPPHQAVQQLVTTIHSRVYVSGRSAGSPADTYGVSTKRV